MIGKNITLKLKNVVAILFVILMVVILFSTIILDKKVRSEFSNTVPFVNIVYYSIAVLILGVILYRNWIKANVKDISRKLYLILLINIPIIVFLLWQFPVGSWIHWFTNEGDFGSIMYAATGFNQGKTFENYWYFFTSPNNSNLAIVLSWIYNIIPSWRAIVIIGAMLTNISAVFVALTIYNVTKSRYVSIVVLVLSEILMAITWRAFLVYTDNFGMIFVALILFVYTMDLDDKYKIPIVTVLSALGTFIKMTVFLCFIAIIIHKFLLWIKELNKKNVHEIIKKTGLVVMIFGIMLVSQNSLREHYGLDLTGRWYKTWHYMFWVGQNTEAKGVVNVEDSLNRDAVVVESKAAGMDYERHKQDLLEAGIERIVERGIIGNIIFYVEKINVAYNDGYFHNVQSNTEYVSNDLERNILYELLVKEDGKYYWVSATIFQIVWDLVILLIAVSCILMYKDEKYLLFKLLILGVTLYLMIFEGRSKYIYMFLPIYMIAAGITLEKMIKKQKTLKNTENQ